jgi:cobyrinic acid a,c-diamide synthase
MKYRRLIISSDRSNSGKTLVTAGLMRVLSRKMKVRPFKIGPDFIDIGYHKIATGVPSINLDLWMMSDDGVKRSLIKYSKGFDISIIEGVMGFYDGIDLNYSTYEVAKVTKTPVILVINCKDLSSTAGAIVYGLLNYKKDNLIKGVIFNKIASKSHFEYCSRSLPEGIINLGYIPYLNELNIPSRHLGLITIEDYYQKIETVIQQISEIIQENINIEKLIEISEDAKKLEVDYYDKVKDNKSKKGKAAIAMDSAFSFYYTENIELLKEHFNLEFFSPLSNEIVKDADFIYLGGGYPELHLNELERAESTKAWIKKSSYDNKLILAECGGLMYLSSTIIDNRKYKMVGLFDIEILAKSKLTIGYTELQTIKSSFISNVGEIIRAHEFHISQPIQVNEKDFAFSVKRGKGIINKLDGVLINNTLGSYSHFHFNSLKSLKFDVF